MLISYALIGLAAVVLRRFGSGAWLTWMIAASALGLVVLTGIHFGMTQITGEGVNGAVFYHMKTGLEGGDVTQYALPAAGALLVLFAATAGLWWGRHLLRPGSAQRRRGVDAVITAFATAALVVHPVSLASAQYALRFALVTQHAEGFVTPATKPTGPAKPRNLVILYLESLERTYMDPARFPGLTPNLAKLETRAISFTDIGQTTGTGFTIGGMVATQCGVPLILSGGANSMRVSSFLNGATCLGDILREAGYTLSYLGGASTEFAGKGAFYRSHGYDEVTGFDELLPMLPDPDYRAEWGLQDDTLFDLARERFDRLASEDAPFVLTLLTLDTHHPNGHAETNRACEGLSYGDGSNPMLNSVLCADHMAGLFVDEILDGPHGDDTVIAVMSDHLAMVNSATDLLEEAPRRNLLMLLDGNTASAPKRIDRPASTLDTAPTLLGHLGFEVPRMGLGTNLLSAEETLPEKLGVSVDERRALDTHVMGYQSVYTRLWAFPDISDGLYVNAELGEVNFGYSAFRTPVLLSFDRDNTVKSATLGDVRAEETLTEAALNLQEGTRYLWIDQCHALAPKDADAYQREQLCALAGHRGAAVDLKEFPGSGFHSAEAVETLLSLSSNASVAADDGVLLESIGQARGDLPRSIPVAGLATGKRGVLVQSNAFGAGASFIRRQTTDTLRAGEDWILGRGVTLAGITADGRAEVIDRLDQCDPTFDAGEHAPWATRIREGGSDFVAHVVTVHDTAYCGSSISGLEAPLAELELPVLRAASMREAYAAVIDSEGMVREVVNRAFDRVKLYLEPSKTAKPLDAPPIPTPALMKVIDEKDAPSVRVARVAAKAAIQPALSGPADTEICRPPSNAATELPTGALMVGARHSGSELSSVVGFTEGWWGEEPAGRWSGSLRSKIAVVLPSDVSDLQLTLGLASPTGENLDLRIEHEGRPLAETRLSGSSNVTFSAKDLPRDRPVYLTVAINGADLDCPAARSGASDPRRIGVMLKSVSLAADTIETSSLANTPLTEEVSGCILASDGSEPSRIASTFPIGRIIPVSTALDTRALALGAGWWRPETAGTWTGRRYAEMTLILPAGSEDLSLELQLATLDSDYVDLALSHEGRLLTRQRVGENATLRANVGALPRGTPVSLDLKITDTAALGCPTSRKTGPDVRALGVMLKAVRLTDRDELPFTSAIAHGGGRFGGAAITNSFEAIAENLSRFAVFEIDFSWTADGELVCLHDWNESFTSRFGITTDQPVVHERFNRLLATSPGRPRNCDLDGLAGWMRAKPGVRIVTDVKDQPVKAHVMIAKRHPDLVTQFVPQAFQPGEIDRYRSLGYTDVIWTLYRYGSDQDSVVREARKRAPSAITMPVSMAEAGLLGAVREAIALPVYVHTVNDPRDVACLLSAGAAGIYSDDLGDADVAALRDASQTCN